MLASMNRSLTLVFIAMFSLSAFSHANAQASSSVSYVGCPSDGQLGSRRAPHRKAKSLTLSPEIANQLAYYQAEQGSGVLAPRGWHCFGVDGSNGSSLFVAPQKIDSKLVFRTNGGFLWPVVQISDSFGGTSGRFEVASIISRVFVSHKAFVSTVIAEGFETATNFPSGPYPKDKLIYRSKEVVEYETPPQVEGLGTRSRLQKNDRAITGVEILVGPDEELDLVSLSVRLPQSSEVLNRAIVQQTRREAAANPRS